MSASGHGAAEPEERRDRREPQAEQERQFREILKYCPAALMVVDEDGRLLLHNAALRRLLGYDEAELELFDTRARWRKFGASVGIVLTSANVMSRAWTDRRRYRFIAEAHEHSANITRAFRVASVSQRAPYQNRFVRLQVSGWCFPAECRAPSWSMIHPHEPASRALTSRLK